MSKEFLAKPRHKKETHREWKQGQIAREDTDNVQAARDKVRKAKAQIKLHVAKDIKGNKKGFYNYLVTKGRLGKMWALS